MKKVMFLLAMVIIFVGVPSMLLAQGTDPVVDPDKVKQILEGFLGAGIGVIAVTELLKRRFKTEGMVSVILSVVVSIAGVAIYLLMTSLFSVLNLLIYSFVVSLAANGIYLFPQSRKKPDNQ